MSSALDTLLAAARFIELQEQQHLSLSSSPPSVRNLGRFHNPNFNNSTNNNNSNNSNSVRNNLRHQQITSPLTSPIYGSLSNNVTISSSNNLHHHAANMSSVAATTGNIATLNNREYGSTLSSASTDIVRIHTDARNEEPYLNDQSLSSSFYVISTSKSSPLLSPSLSKEQQKQQQQQQQREHSQKQKCQQQQHNNNEDNKNNSKSNNILNDDDNDDDDDQIMIVDDDNDELNKKSLIQLNNNQSKYRLPTTINSNNYSVSPSLLSNYKFYSSSSKIISSQNNNKKFVPLTPPPMSNNSYKKIEITRTRSLSFSSNKFTANNGGGIINNNNSNSSSSSNNNTTSPSSLSSLSSSSIISSGNVNSNNNSNNNNSNNSNNNNNVGNNPIMMMTSSVTEDSSQSSLNLSSSGYLSGSSVNSNSGNCTPSININLLNHSIGVNNTNNNSIINSDHHHQQQNILSSSSSSSLSMQSQQATSAMTISTTTTSGRRRTTSTNSNGGTQRSPCILRAGTREVHNKLEKHRRAHLKECFEQLKIQLQLKDEDRKKPSNLAILGAAYKHVMSLRRRERELEQQVEQLAKEKINAQKKIFNLKRELSVKYDNIDFSNIISDGDVGNIPNDRESLSDTASLSSGRGSIRYSSSSSLSSVNTISSPVGSSIQSSVPATLSPVISSSSLSSSSIPPTTTTSPSSPSLKSSSSPILTNNVIPLSLTTKNHHNTSPTTSSLSSSSLQMESPIPSTPSPSPSSSSGISCSPITSSSSPPMITHNLSSSLSDNLKLPTNVPNGIKLSHYPITSQQSNVTIVATTAVGNNNLSTSATNIISSNDNGCLNSSSILNTSNSNGIHHQPSYGFTSQNVQISASTPKDLNGKNGICNRKNPFLDSTKGEVITSSSGSMVPTTNLVSVGGGGIGTNVNCAKEIKVEKISFDDSEQPTKVIKLFNGIALAPVDKDNKLLSSAPLALSQVVGGGGLVVSPFPVLTAPSHQGLRVIGAANGLATIELSTPAAGVQSHNRNQQQQQSQSVITPSSVSTVTSTSAGAQLHKLLVSAGTQSQINHHPTVVNSPLTHATTNVAPELARLPGGAELNILPAGVNGSTTLYRGNGKLAIVNNGITLKGTETNGTTGRAVHVVTPIQSAGAGSISGLAPIVVSQGGQQGNNLAQLIASTSQLTGKVNLSVGGQTLPLISTQYLGSMKPMVVAVANNPTTTATVAGTTITENCSSS